MDTLQSLVQPSTWQAFLDFKTARGRMTARDQTFLRAFIAEEGYRSLAGRLAEGDYTFPLPEKRRVNKHGSSKKRVVYRFAAAENWLLKVIAWQLRRYDHLHAPNCYSFRSSIGAGRAVRSLTGTPGIDALYGYKVDVADYFNSMDVDLLLPMLDRCLADDPALLEFLRRLLTADCSIENDVRIEEKRGAMAGTPIAPFLANLYLDSVDRLFLETRQPYARYSDDILFFAPSAAERDRHAASLRDALTKLRLAINPAKERAYEPGDPWDFLGIRYHQGTIDLSPVSRDKLKAKLRRKARALFRWKTRHGADDPRTVKAFARAVNRKLFANPRADELTWARWFFPLLTTDRSLREIDAFIQEKMRFLCSGCYRRANYRVCHAFLQTCGYRSLVGEYYRSRRALD